MVQVGEKYRHYKSTGGDDHTYEVIGIGFFQWKQAYEDELMVIYKPLYQMEWLDPKVTHFIRPLSERFTQEEWQWNKVVRFTKIG